MRPINKKFCASEGCGKYCDSIYDKFCVRHTRTLKKLIDYWRLRNDKK